eukprot:7296744-Prorocentrum_lima.AAC.1
MHSPASARLAGRGRGGRGPGKWGDGFRGWLEPATGGEVCSRRCNAVEEKYMRFVLHVHEEKLLVGPAEATAWKQQAAACPRLCTFSECARAARGSWGWARAKGGTEATALRAGLA